MRCWEQPPFMFFQLEIATSYQIINKKQHVGGEVGVLS